MGIEATSNRMQAARVFAELYNESPARYRHLLQTDAREPTPNLLSPTDVLERYPKLVAQLATALGDKEPSADVVRPVLSQLAKNAQQKVFGAFGVSIVDAHAQAPSLAKQPLQMLKGVAAALESTWTEAAALAAPSKTPREAPLEKLKHSLSQLAKQLGIAAAATRSGMGQMETRDERLRALNGVLHDVAALVRPLPSADAVESLQKIATSLFGGGAVVVDQGDHFELWSKANPRSPQKVADLGSGAPLSLEAVANAKGFRPPDVGEHPADQARLTPQDAPWLAHFGTALGETGRDATAGTLFDLEDKSFEAKPNPSAALEAQHARNQKATVSNPVPLSVMSFNVALLDINPADQYTAGFAWGRQFTADQKEQRHQTLVSPLLAERRPLLPEKILDTQKDVILLQEVWKPEDVWRFQRAAAERGYLALTNPRDKTPDGLMVLVKKSIVDSSHPIEQTGFLYPEAGVNLGLGALSEEEDLGGLQRGFQKVRFRHKDAGWMTVANTHTYAMPEHWAARRDELRTFGLMLREAPAGDVVIGGGDLNGGPYYDQDSYRTRDGQDVGSWYKNSLSYWTLLHYADGMDGVLAGRPASDVQGDLAAAKPGGDQQPGVWPFTATSTNPLYARQYDELPARMDHLVLAGTRPAKVTSSRLEMTGQLPFTEEGKQVSYPLSDHYGVSVQLEVEKATP